MFPILFSYFKTGRVSFFVFFANLIQYLLFQNAIYIYISSGPSIYPIRVQYAYAQKVPLNFVLLILLLIQ